ncbi:galactosylgalactosylxylosyl 3-beta-glucuronosyltransferase I-like [Brachionus plicatilis]|uniref:Galactosylgalactosylxylosylprotein 3-beta-glucuronosyltransferase n=1 Tax=Brachionus plicatilis TaxID=10195 RepID=A0A3M7PA08_BRAPC|nr:galactosylgalactosylxylosyl 3-beta-glucuronosyltransferase I-like [Brachionus plicatilis]
MNGFGKEIFEIVYLSLYEAEEKYEILHKKFESLHSFFDKFHNISFPIIYSLKFYEKYDKLPIIYIITPTNNRVETQLADLTRLRNTLWLVPKIVWILIEDSAVKTRKIENFLKLSKMSYVHLSEETPDDWRVQSSEKSWSKPRGVLQRNKGIQWLRENSGWLDHSGVVYFADDDNTYDIRLFEEMRYTKTVSVWPVAFVGELMYERPICKINKVIGWFRSWGDKRPFPIDMAGFAVNLKLLLAHPSARFSHLVLRGMQESHLLSHLVSINELEPKAQNCTRVDICLAHEYSKDT